MKKIVLSLELHDNNIKQKAMKAVSTLSGIDSISIDMKEQKMTVIGPVDPVHVVRKLKKSWQPKLVSVGPAKEPEKKEEAKKEEAKKDEPKKEEAKKDEPKKEEPKKADEAEKKKETSPNPNPNSNPYPYPNDIMIAEMARAYQTYDPPMTTHYYVKSAEENPNSCVIC